jgi:2-dehydropantoate 2-reductase
MAEFEFAILGAGAMSSIVGGHRRAGHSVAMLARGTRASQLESQGISIRGLAEFSVPVIIDAQGRAFGVLSTVAIAPLAGSNGVGDVSRELSYLGSHTSFGVTLSIQNGPLKNDILVEAFGREQVLGALADTSGELLVDGTVLFTRNVNIFVGELAGGDSARARQLAAALDGAGVRATATSEILTLEWSKFCSGRGSWCWRSPRGDLEVPLGPGRRAALRLVREMGLLARALNITVSDRAILPTASICGGSEAEAVTLIMAAGAHYRHSAPAHRMSALQDVEAGRPLEVNETLGYACDKARALRLDLPLLESFRRLVAATDRARRDAVALPAT